MRSRSPGSGSTVRDGRRSPHATAPASIFPFEVERAIHVEVGTIRSSNSLGAAVYDPDGLLAAVAGGAVSVRGAATLRLADVVEPVLWQVADGVDPPGGAPPGRRLRRPPTGSRCWSTSPFPGLPIFIAVTLGSFAAMVVVGGALSAWMAAFWSATVSPVLTTLVTTLVPFEALATAILWALDGGLIAMLTIGIPYVLTFYLLVAFLEDSGYLTSAAVLMDRIFNVLGLPGRTAVPLLTAAGCNVPGIYGTRILATHRERLLGAFLVTLTPCSARTAVVIAALAPLAGPLVALAAFAVVAGGHVRRRVSPPTRSCPGRQPALVLELAPLRVPVVRHVAAKAWSRFRSFVVMATPIMLVGSFVLGLVYASGLWAQLAAVIGSRHGNPARPAGDRGRGHHLRVPAQGAGLAAARRAGDRPVRRKRGHARRLHVVRATVRVRDRRLDLRAVRGHARDPGRRVRLATRARDGRRDPCAGARGRDGPGADPGDRARLTRPRSVAHEPLSETITYTHARADIAQW